MTENRKKRTVYEETPADGPACCQFMQGSAHPNEAAIREKPTRPVESTEGPVGQSGINLTPGAARRDVAHACLWPMLSKKVRGFPLERDNRIIRVYFLNRTCAFHPHLNQCCAEILQKSFSTASAQGCPVGRCVKSAAIWVNRTCCRRGRSDLVCSQIRNRVMCGRGGAAPGAQGLAGSPSRVSSKDSLRTRPHPGTWRSPRALPQNDGPTGHLGPSRGRNHRPPSYKP